AALRPALARRRVRDDLLVRALQHARAGALHVDAACGTQRRGRLLRETALALSRSARIGPPGSLDIGRRVSSGDVRADVPPVSQNRHGNLPQRRNEADSAAAARTDGYPPRANRAD